MYHNLPKTGDINAWIIAEHLRFGRINEEIYMDDKYKALQKLTRTRFHTVQNLARDKNWFLNNLFLKFSSLTQEKIFYDKFRTTFTGIIEEFFSVDEIPYMLIEKSVDFINKKGKDISQILMKLLLFKNQQEVLTVSLKRLSTLLIRYLLFHLQQLKLTRNSLKFLMLLLMSR